MPLAEIGICLLTQLTYLGTRGFLSETGTMSKKFPMEVRVSPELAYGRDQWSRDGVTRSVSNFSTFTDIFSQKLGDFCDSFAKGIDPVNSRLSHYMLDTIEMHIELTSKGEIRLVASANADVRGAIKLTFRARRRE